MRRWRWSSVAAAALTVAAVATLGISVASYGWIHDDMGLWVGIAGTGLVGALLVARRPGNAVSWLVAAAAAIGAVGGVLNWALPDEPSPGDETLVMLLAVTALLLWIAYLFVMVGFVPLLFPTGRVVSPRWRWVLSLGAVYALTILALNLVQREFCPDPDDLSACVDNPIGVAWVPNLEFGFDLFWHSMLVFMGVAVASLAVRYVRAQGIERRQLAWFTLAFVAWISMRYAELALERFDVALEDSRAWTAAGEVIWILMPVSIAVGIFKYRLFEIDRIIGRTVSWALISAVLVAIYAGTVVTLSGAARSLTGDRNSTLAVAASTLLAAAAFGPVRRRVQALVDRRFNRARYDALRTVEEFGATLRTSPDPALAADQLVSTVHGSLHPERVQLVLREEPA